MCKRVISARHDLVPYSCNRLGGKRGPQHCQLIQQAPKLPAVALACVCLLLPPCNCICSQVRRAHATPVFCGAIMCYIVEARQCKSTNAASRCARQWDARGQCSGLQLRGKWTSHIRALSSTPSKCIPCCSISTVYSTLCIASTAAGDHTFWAHIAWVQRRRV
jgi:hypothetical protein